MLLHERLCALRIKKGFKTQAAFCRYAKLNGYKMEQRRYGSLERGDTEPNIKDITLLCGALGASADYLLFGDELAGEVRDLLYSLAGKVGKK